jgi:hypothetical protein
MLLDGKAWLTWDELRFQVLSDVGGVVVVRSGMFFGVQMLWACGYNIGYNVIFSLAFLRPKLHIVVREAL